MIGQAVLIGFAVVSIGGLTALVISGFIGILHSF
jgi:hypothetical protein